MASSGASRPTATLLSSAAVLLALLLSAAAPTTSASQLNLYKGKWCTESFTSCWDRQCCVVPGDAVSYRFYYNPNWKGYLYTDESCSGNANSVLESDVSCAQGVNFKRALLTDGSGSQQFIAQE